MDFFLAGIVARETLGTKKKYALPTPRQINTKSQEYGDISK